jgi:hypothetical protein
MLYKFILIEKEGFIRLLRSFRSEYSSRSIVFIYLMSTYGGQGQFDDPELDRQFQDEFRRRQQQALQSGGSIGNNPSLAISAGRVRPPDAYSQHHMLLQHHSDVAATGSSPYGYPHNGIGGQPHHASPYARVNNPYAAMDAAHVAYSQSHGMLNSTPQGTSDTVAQLYAAQQRRAQVAGAYGYNAGAPASRAALEQHYASYGMTGNPAYYAHEGAYSGQSAQDAAMHHQQMQDAYARSGPMLLPPSTYRAMDNEGEGDKLGSSDDANSLLKAKSSSAKAKDGKTKNRMLQKVTSTYTNMKTNARVVVKDGTTVIEDGDDTWYTGCVPLGVEDDKYWLSELQVYLRSSFAEAFGATEDDIAAPMHGRNKPIALGQVGIRCVHCKRKLKWPYRVLPKLFDLTENLLDIYRGKSRGTWTASNILP